MTDARHAAASAAPGTAVPAGTMGGAGKYAGAGGNEDTGPQAVLFDMDGLLIDSEPLWFAVETDVMIRLGGTWTEADQQAILGSSLADSVRYFLGRASAPADPAQIAEWMIGGIVARVRERGVTIMPGAAELVAEVEAAGLPCALVTSSQRRLVDAVLARTGLRFPVLVCANDVTRGKPDPESYLLAAERLGAEPGRCVVLEDSPTGVAAAEAAGCQVVAVPTLHAIEPRPGRPVVGSLRDISLGWLRAAWATRPELPRRPVWPGPAGDAAPGCPTGRCHWPSWRRPAHRRPPSAHAAGSGTRPGAPSR
jgi:HAD superfamily hydrolase (TIGR01509 family)